MIRTEAVDDCTWLDRLSDKDRGRMTVDDCTCLDRLSYKDRGS